MNINTLNVTQKNLNEVDYSIMSFIEMTGPNEIKNNTSMFLILDTAKKVVLNYLEMNGIIPLKYLREFRKLDSYSLDVIVVPKSDKEFFIRTLQNYINNIINQSEREVYQEYKNKLFKQFAEEALLGKK